MQLFARMKAAVTRAAPAAPTLARDAAGLAGLASVAIGAWQLSHGLGWIVGGLEAVVVVLITAPSPKPHEIEAPPGHKG